MFKNLNFRSSESITEQSVYSSGEIIEPQKSSRLNSIDYLRGIIMVIMALDHVKSYFTEIRFDPLDLSQTSPELFFTRWITHFCAPVFVFLAGTGAFLSLSRGKIKKELSKFLLSRGLWLIILELTVIRFGWLFNLDYSLIIFQVIWAIGASMIVLAGLVFFPNKIIAGFGIVMICTHNLFDGISASTFGDLGWIWTILHISDIIPLGDGNSLLAFYPLIPWIGVMAAGYSFGSIMRLEKTEREKILLFLGIFLTVSFIALRYLNIYGDPNLWSVQNNFLYTILSFLNTTKYPPSLLFLLMTLGPSILALYIFEKYKGTVSKFFLIFGRVPFFFYILHIYLIHALAAVAASIMYDEISFLFTNGIFNYPAGWGFSLSVVYLI